MSRTSALRDGFAAAWRHPAAVFAEIAWRWTFGAAALALIAMAVGIYLSSLLISRVELLALRSHSPWLMGDAVAHILRGSGPRLLRITAIITPALMATWVATASFGRAATLARLARENLGGFSQLVQLNIFRAIFFVVSLLALLGAAVLAGYAANAGVRPRLGIFFLVFLSLTCIVTIARSRANWFAYLAAIFVVVGGCPASAALRRSAELFSRRSAEFAISGMVFAFLRLFTGVLATLMSLSALGFVWVAPRLTVVMLVLITLMYCAIADFLYIARLAGYVALARETEEQDGSEITAVPPVGEEEPTATGQPAKPDIVPPDAPPLAN